MILRKIVFKMNSNELLKKVIKLTGGSCSPQSSSMSSSSVVKCWKWDLSLLCITEETAAKYAVVVLNRPILQNTVFINHFWNNATVRVTVDGGTRHWDKFLSNFSEGNRMCLPDLVTGDFDSITPDVLEKYKKQGCKIVHTPDQDHTDFTKALIELNNHCVEQKIQIDHVITLAQNSGRIDQILGNIQTLFLVKDKQIFNQDTRVYLLSDDDITWLLYPGDHVIDIPEEIRTNKRVWCALIPVGEPCQYVTTSGLKWNLDNQQLKFGEIVSTSNTFDGSEQVKVKCSHPLLWAMKIPSLSSTII